MISESSRSSYPKIEGFGVRGPDHIVANRLTIRLVERFAALVPGLRQSIVNRPQIEVRDWSNLSLSPIHRGRYL